jgi:hypothetical protein
MLVPYTDATIYPAFDISLAPVQIYCLGFVVADADADPSWGGYHKTTSEHYMDMINKIRQKGGDVIVSFGGAAGIELASATFSVTDLYEKYKSVVERYSLKSIDLDIEGTALYDTETCIRRGKAIEALQKNFPQLEVSLTVPVMPTGLSQDALDCIDVTPHSLLNIMAMDFGREKDMGMAVIAAIQATRRQTDKMIGVTVMIGNNDTPEIFSLNNAKALKTFLRKNLWVTRVSIWALERDRGVSGSLAHSSQIRQKKWEFTNLLKS